MHPALMIQTAGGELGVVSDQFSVRGEQQFLTFLHDQPPADGCLNKRLSSTVLYG